MHTPTPGLVGFRRQLRRAGLHRLSYEQRIYASALLVGILLNLWAALAALQAQGRFPQFTFQLPSLDDIALPGRPVLRPILDPGELRTEVSEAATVGHLRVAIGSDVFADVTIPPPGLARPARLVARANLPRLFASAPPIDDFRALRLLDVYLADARSGNRVEASGATLELRVAVRPIDLERAGGDASRLLLLRWDPDHETWLNTNAGIDNGYLVAVTDGLSPFAVGLVLPDTPADNALLGLFGPQPAPTSTPTPRPAADTPTPRTEDPPGVPLAGGIPAIAPVLMPATPTVAAAPPSPTPLPASLPGVTGLATPEPTTEPTSPEPLQVQTATPIHSAATATPPTPSTSVGASTMTTIVSTPTAELAAAAATDAPLLTLTATAQPTLTVGPALTSTPAVTPLPTPAGRLIDLSRPPANGDMGRLFDLANSPTLRPGNQAVTNLTVLNGGAMALTYGLSVDATSSSPLDTNTVEGLQLTVVRCGATFSVCTETVYAGPAVTTATPMGGPENVGSGSARGLRPFSLDFLQLRVLLPASAGNAIEGASSTLRFSWDVRQAL